ncbi:MAG: Zn-dependent hydrolase [Magnetococcales bacterium]|nr:Zn-dependent hydrolase [Magnetococcales bacterium]
MNRLYGMRVVFLAGLIGTWIAGAGALARADASEAEVNLRRYVTVPLSADLSALNEAEKKMLPLLADAARAMDAIFWRQSVGDPEALFAVPWDASMRELMAIHYGPWDRMENHRPLIPGIAPKPDGARFYPPNLTREAFEAAAKEQPELKDPFALVRRQTEGKLEAVPYHLAFAGFHALAADRLRQAAALAPDEAQARYLETRAEALLTDRYRESDMAWMAMKENRLDIIIGPIETYEDGLMGLKTAHEALILIRDEKAARRLDKQNQRLPIYQTRLPVPEIYRAEKPGAESDLGVYDAVMMTGDAAATRPIALNLPNDEQVQLEKGSRRLQLRNAMQAKFDKILLPMAKLLLEPDHLPQVTFEALFANTLFHEIAHGLGVKKLVNGSGETVNDALREDAWMMEEGKADALALWLGDLDAELARVESGQEDDTAVSVQTRCVTEFASLFRSIRFGPASAHARANLIRFNFLAEQGAFTRDDEGRYRVDTERMRAASRELAGLILRLQGDGDLEGVRMLEKRHGTLSATLIADLQRVEAAAIPIDVVFKSAL